MQPLLFRRLLEDLLVPGESRHGHTTKVVIAAIVATWLTQHENNNPCFESMPQFSSRFDSILVYDKARYRTMPFIASSHTIEMRPHETMKILSAEAPLSGLARLHDSPHPGLGLGWSCLSS